MIDSSRSSWDIAMGRVIYRTDQHLVDLGYQGADAYVKGENGEAVCPPNPKMLRFLLELLHPDEWGKHRKIDVPHKGDVLVVGYIAKKPEYSTAASVKARKWKSCSRRIRKAKA
jgi:hypothetical protein